MKRQTGRPVSEWLERRGITLEDAGIDPATDLQTAPFFPVQESFDPYLFVREAYLQNRRYQINDGVLPDTGFEDDDFSDDDFGDFDDFDETSDATTEDTIDE